MTNSLWASPIDPVKLLRALRLRVERTGPRRFAVTVGNSESRTVLLGDRGRPATCDCGDAASRPLEACVHVLGALIFRRLPYPVIQALRQLTVGYK